jgi:glycosyltransferase involved in cell wall biosynthesis
MSFYPLVSVVVPCFNAGNTILKTINSLLLQTWTNIEIIIVNDGSTDSNTKDKLNEIAINSKIQLINQKNMGLSNARNNGIAIAMGDFILPLDADDWLEPDAVHLMVNASKNLKLQSVIYTDIKLNGDRSGTKLTFCNPFEQLFSNQLPYCMLIPKIAFMETKGYDKNFTKGLEDWDFNINLILKDYGFFKINLPLFNYRVDKDSMFNSITSSQFGSIYSKIMLKYGKSYSLKRLFLMAFKSRKIDSKRNLYIYIFQFILMRITGPVIFSKVFTIFNKYLKK